jgi:hypothetical protein
VIGPFGFEGGDLIGTPYGPEGEGGLTRASDKGKRGDVSWRDVPEAWLRDAVVPLGALLRPDSQAAAYALTWVDNDRARDLTVRVGSSGAVKVWVGGVLAVEKKVKSRAYALDQDAGTVRVERGWTPVLVKVAVEDGNWAFVLRLTEPGGAPVVLASARAPAGALARVSPSKARTVTLRGATSPCSTSGTRRRIPRPSPSRPCSTRCPGPTARWSRRPSSSSPATPSRPTSGGAPRTG